MIPEPLSVTVEEHTEESAEGIADALYTAVKEALARGQRRAELYATLKAQYDELKARGLTKQRRAVGEVIRCFDGYCAPSAAL